MAATSSRLARRYNVDGTPFDFRKPEKIGARIEADDPQIKFGGGYDHNFNLNKGSAFAKAAELYDEKSGRVMSVYTDQPGVQIYTSNMMNGDVKFKGGLSQIPRSAICLEDTARARLTESSRIPDDHASRRRKV